MPASMDGGDARQHVFLAFRIGLMQHAFITDADGPGLVRVNPGDQHQFFFYFFLHAGQAVNVVQYRVLVVGGTGANHQDEAVIAAGNNLPDFFISCGFDGGSLSPERIILHQFLGRWQLPYEFHLHFHLCFLVSFRIVYIIPYFPGER